MKTSPVWLVGIVFCCASAVVAAQTPQKYSVERKVKFEPGNAQMTQGLKSVESIREIVASGYMIAAEDLNDDKYPEIIVLASSSNLCVTAGCSMVVLRNTGPGRFEKLAEHFASPDLGVTREQVNGYRLLANLDAKGGIALAGDAPIVHAMQVGAPPTAAPIAVAGDGPSRELLNVKLGMSLEEAKTALGSLKPPLAPNMPDVKVVVPLLPDGAFVASYYAPQQAAVPGAAFKAATVQFSPPPGPSRAVAISQNVQYGANDAPTVANFLAALREKYGNAHQTRQTSQTSAKLYWAWSPDGSPLPAAQLQRCDSIGQSLAAGNRTPLFRSRGFLNEADQLVSASRQAGCGLYAYADYASDGSFVTGMNVVVADVAAADAALAQTVQDVDRLARAQHSRALEDAKDRKPDL